MNADMLPEFANQAGEEFFGGRYSIGLWFWEIAQFPDRWRELVLAARGGVGAHLAHRRGARADRHGPGDHGPHSDPAAARSSRARDRELGLPEDKFMFLFSFDYLSVFKRKNPLAVIDAFSTSVRAR